MSLRVEINTMGYSIDEEGSFKRIVGTVLGSRTMRPYFGSELYRLIDRTMDAEFQMLFNRYLFDCFFDENHKPWDDRLIPSSINIVDIEATAGSIKAKILFADGGSIVFNTGGF